MFPSERGPRRSRLTKKHEPRPNSSSGLIFSFVLGWASRVDGHVLWSGCRDVMLTEYIDEALRRARYELIEDDEPPYYGEIPELPGVWASGRTLEDCRRELKEVVEGWILISVGRSLDIPRLGSCCVVAGLA